MVELGGLGGSGFKWVDRVVVVVVAGEDKG